MKSFKLFFIVLAFGPYGFCVVSLLTQKIIFKCSYPSILLSRTYNRISFALYGGRPLNVCY